MSNLDAKALADLGKSGLSEATIEQAGIFAATQKDISVEILARAPHSYVLPYCTPDGVWQSNFHRIKCLPALENKEGKLIRYLQPKNSGVHIYLPPTMWEKWPDWVQNADLPLLLTEGEKKALKAVQEGFPTIAVAGVESWRSRLFKIKQPDLIESDEEKKIYIIKIGDATDAIEEILAQIAPELTAINWDGRNVYIAFDSDYPTNLNVQRAAFDLGVHLDDNGANVFAVWLPGTVGEKVALDDYLCEHPTDELRELIKHATFPTRPALKSWIRNQLDQSRVGRKLIVRTAKAVLADLDANGVRYYDTHDYAWFDNHQKILKRFDANSEKNLGNIRATPFGETLFTRYGIGTADTQMLSRIADQFVHCKEGIIIAKTHNVSATYNDTFYYQLSDSDMIRMTSEDLEIVDNGTDGVLMRAGLVTPPNIDLLMENIAAIQESSEPIHAFWYDILWNTNIQPMGNMTREETIWYLTGVMYLSPWLRKWRGLMLPVELVVAEPGSGKTSLQNLRLGVFTGNLSLGSPPADLRDWLAQIKVAPGIWVCDNFGPDIDPKLRDAMSNEIARLTTDPAPKFVVRKLYTTADMEEIKIDTIFTFTSIYNPFNKQDILQRALTYSMAELEGTRDGNWYRLQLDNGGRERWLANHLVAIQRFFQNIDIHWDADYHSQHRLANYEQALLMMGRVLGQLPIFESIVSKLLGVIDDAVGDNDAIIEVLQVFMEEWQLNAPTTAQRTRFEIQEIVNWVRDDGNRRFNGIKTLLSAAQLSKYIQAHAATVRRATKLSLVKKEKGRRELEVIG